MGKNKKKPGRKETLEKNSTENKTECLNISANEKKTKNEKKRKSDTDEIVSTSKKIKLNSKDSSSKNVKENTTKKLNKPKKLKKFAGTGSIDKETSQEDSTIEIDKNENSSDSDSNYDVTDVIKPDEIIKTQYVDSDEEVETAKNKNDDQNVDSDDEEMENAKNENDENQKKAKNKTKKDNKEPLSKEAKEQILNSITENMSSKGKMRYVLFLGNLPFNVSIDEIKDHFKNTCKIVNVRLPKSKETNKPRGFAYLDVEDKESYLKALSLHHSFLNGRRINVEYTTGGKKHSKNIKQFIKSKNLKLTALRKDGKFAGNKKHSNKRSVRRAKKRFLEKKNNE